MKTHLGHYEIVSELGRGGMGVVYKGYEPALGRHVAIKELSPALAHDPNLVERFLREARSMAALQDPHIIQVYFIGTDENTQQPFFAMEFIDGDSLSGLLKREGKLSVENSLKILHQTAQGLASAHDKGVIHRDIKPGNLMLTHRGQVKIADFGIALATQDISKKLTSTGEFVGTPGYLSPEVCLGKVVDQRSDIFSLGIVLFEMLSGKTPFTDESPLGLMLEVVKAEIPDIRGINAEVDPQTAAILTRMVAKEPQDRFQSCHDLAAALEAHPLVAKGGTVKLPVSKPAASDATMIGVPTPGAQPQRLVTPPPMIGRAPTPAPASPGAPTSASAAALPQAPVRASVLDRPEKKSGSALPLAVAAALVLVLAGGAWAFRAPLGAFIAGFGDGFTGDKAYEQGVAAGAASNPVGTTQAATLEPVPPPAVALPTQPAAPAVAPVTTSDANTAATTPAPLAPDTPTVAAADSATTTPAEPAVAPDTTEVVAANDSAAANAGLKRLLAAKRAARNEIASSAPPREVAAPRTPKIVVVTMGDDAITSPARQRIEERLMDAGFDVVDADVLGVSGRDLPGMLRSLRGDATVAVVVRADGIGQQTLTYYGQSSELYSVNLSVRAYLVGDGRTLGPGFKEKVDFTSLNANTQAEAAIDPRLDRLLGDLSPYRRGRG
jgi:serine/threonine protein kinase